MMDQPGKITSPARGRPSRKIFFPCPRSRLKIWSRETGSAVPSRASLIILHSQTEFGAYSRDFCRFSRRRPLIYTVRRLRASPEFIRPRKCIPMSFSSPQGSSSNGCCLFRYHHVPIFMRLSFPTPTTSTLQWTHAILMQKVSVCKYKMSS